ncbi:hypothetical protein OG381_30195 [Streptomyces sp. NBC_00490]
MPSTRWDGGCLARVRSCGFTAGTVTESAFVVREDLVRDALDPKAR